MEEEIIEQTYSTKYALLDNAAYTELNQAISDAFGFKDGEATSKYTTTTPELDINGMSVMIITGEVQERFPELFINIDLVDNYDRIIENNEL